jgi:hypothetical protein
MPSAVRAECTDLSPWPSFSEAVPSASRVFVGRVSGLTPDAGRDQAGHKIPMNDFRLELESVLRGSAPNDLEFHGFRSGAPQPTCPGDSVLWVRLGDRIAFAYGARLSGLDRTINAVAFVDGSRPIKFLNPRMEQLSLERIQSLVELPPTDTLGSDETAWSSGALLAMLFAAVGLLMLARPLGVLRRPR